MRGLCSLLLVACASDPEPQPPAVDPPDTAADPTPIVLKDIVILYTFDTIRRDTFNAVDMPNVMGLAAEGLWAPDLWHAGSWTYMGCAAMSTGHSPVDLGEDALLLGAEGAPALPESAVTLAELAAEAGIPAAWRTQNRVCGDTTNLQQGWDYAVEGEVAGRLVEKGLAWLGEHPTGRRLLWLHSRGGHFPYNALDQSCQPTASVAGPSCPYDLSSGESTSTRSLLLDMNRDYLENPGAAHWPDCDLKVAALNGCQSTLADREVGGLVAALAEQDLLDDVTLILLADHGEGWDVETERYDHGNNLSPGVTRGAAVLWQQGMTPQVIDAPVAQVDVFPTVLELLGQPLAPSQGTSWLHPVPTDRTLLQFWCRGEDQGSAGVRGTRRYKLGADGSEGLYDTVADPTEAHDLSGSEQADPALSEPVRAQREAAATWCRSQE